MINILITKYKHLKRTFTVANINSNKLEKTKSERRIIINSSGCFSVSFLENDSMFSLEVSHSEHVQPFVQKYFHFIK